MAEQDAGAGRPAADRRWMTETVGDETVVVDLAEQRAYALDGRSARAFVRLSSDLSRRRLLASGAALTGGTILAVALPSVAAAASAGTTRRTHTPQLYAWGTNVSGQLGEPGVSGSATPLAVTLPGGVTPTAVAAGQNHSLAIAADPVVYAWGDDTYGQLGPAGSSGAAPAAVALPGGVTPTAIAAGANTSYALGSDGNVYAWGFNGYGDLGNGGTASSASPVEVGIPEPVTAIAAGTNFGLALGASGTAYAWGYGPLGSLGNGASPTSSTPVTVSKPAGASSTFAFTAIAAGGLHGLAIGSDDNLYAWGYGYNGQLGNGKYEISNVPVQVALQGLRPVAIAGGGYHSLAIVAGGALYAWGDNSHDALGQTGIYSSDTPLVVPLGVGATGIAAGAFQSFAIGADGTLYGWGADDAGQLGDGTTASSPVATPTAVALAAGVTPTAVAAGADHGLAIAVP